MTPGTNIFGLLMLSPLQLMIQLFLATVFEFIRNKEKIYLKLRQTETEATLRKNAVSISRVLLHK